MSNSLSAADLAVEVMAAIEMNPDRWNQLVWRTHLPKDGEDLMAEGCTTSFCYAGWVAVLDGAKWFDTDRIGNPDLCTCQGSRCTRAAHAILVYAYAAERLELEGNESSWMFDPSRTLDDLRVASKLIAEGESLPVPGEPSRCACGVCVPD